MYNFGTLDTKYICELVAAAATLDELAAIDSAVTECENRARRTLRMRNAYERAAELRLEQLVQESTQS
jgi:hypothetical protein